MVEGDFRAGCQCHFPLVQHHIGFTTYWKNNNSRLVALHLSSDKSTGEEGDYKEKNKTFQRTLTALSASGCLEDYSTLRAVLKDNFYVGVFTQIRSVVLTVKKTTRNE